MISQGAIHIKDVLSTLWAAVARRLTWSLPLGSALAIGLVVTAEAAREQKRPDSGSRDLTVQRPVEIGNDSGGNVAEYALRMYELQATKQQVKFVGRCDSACTLFLALPPEHTCITDGAYFRFHAPSAPTALAAARVEDYMMRKYPKWVRAWILAQGGLTGALVTMNYDYANKFIRTCA